MNLCTRRRFEPDPDGYYNVDIVSEYRRVVGDSPVLVRLGYVVLSLSLSGSLCIALEWLCGACYLLVLMGLLLVFFRSAGTVGLFPTIFCRLNCRFDIRIVGFVDVIPCYLMCRAFRPRAFNYSSSVWYNGGRRGCDFTYLSYLYAFRTLGARDGILTVLLPNVYTFV